jgi:hypothetical protein
MPFSLLIRQRRTWRQAGVCSALLLLLHAAPSSAGPITDPAAFFTAIAGLPGAAATLDFESFADGDSPDGANGIHFNFIVDAFGNSYPIVVRSTFETTSPPNYLGIEDGGSGVFLALDQWEMTFNSPLLALGMFFITNPDGLVEGDIEIRTDAGIVSNAATPFGELDDGGLVYFLGLVSDGAPFSDATIGYGEAVTDIFFEYNVDDITTVRVVPEPSALAFASMLLGAYWARKRTFRKQNIRSETCVY